MYQQSTIMFFPHATIPITDIDLAYAAGLFDGEGTVTIVLTHSTKTGNPHHQLSVTLANTNFAIVHWLKDRFGGSIYANNVSVPNRRDTVRWQMGARQAATFLRAIRPYLQIKAAAADIAIELQDSRQHHRACYKGLPRGRGNVPMDPGVFAAREEMRKRLNAVNKRGAEWPTISSTSPAS